MCRALKEAGCGAKICTTSADGQSTLPVPLAEWIEYEGVETIFFPATAKEFKYSREMASWLDVHAGEFDVAHIHAVFNHSSIAAARACRRHGVPYIVRPLGTLDPWSMGQKALKKRLFWSAFGKHVLQNAAAVHYTSEGEKHAVETTLNVNHGVVVPLGVELPPKTHHSSPITHHVKEPYVLFLSRLHPKKGLEVLIEAFGSVVAEAQFRNWKLLIAGDGEAQYVCSLKTLVNQHQLERSVEFLGWLDDEEKFSRLNRASLFVLPSYQENFGVSVVEAMATGVPVLVSPHVNLAGDVETAGAGWVVPTNVSSLREGLMRALSSETELKHHGRAARVLAANFSWLNTSRHLVDLYQSLAA